MRSLPTAVRMHILTELACFGTPGQVAASVKERFGIEVSRQCVEAHHPERRAGAKLNPALRALFHLTRARLRAELDDIPIACKSYRLKVLDRVAHQAEEMGSLALAARIIEQAAREAADIAPPISPNAAQNKCAPRVRIVRTSDALFKTATKCLCHRGNALTFDGKRR